MVPQYPTARMCAMAQRPMMSVASAEAQVSPLVPAIARGIFWIAREFAGVERPTMHAVCAMVAIPAWTVREPLMVQHRMIPAVCAMVAIPAWIVRGHPLVRLPLMCVASVEGRAFHRAPAIAPVTQQTVQAHAGVEKPWMPVVFVEGITACVRVVWTQLPAVMMRPRPLVTPVHAPIPPPRCSIAKATARSLRIVQVVVEDRVPTTTAECAEATGPPV